MRAYVTPIPSTAAACRGEVLGEVPVRRVEAHRESGIEARLPHRVPVVIADVGLIVLVGGTRHDDAAETHAGDALDLRDGARHVPVRDHAHWHEALGGRGDEVELEVVVGTYVGDRHLRIVERDERVERQPGDVRVQHGDSDAGGVHRLEPLANVVRGRLRIGECWWGGRERLIPSPHRTLPCLADDLLADLPHLCLHRLVPADVHPQVAPRIRQPARPEVGRFDDVGVGVKDHRPSGGHARLLGSTISILAHTKTLRREVKRAPFASRERRDSQARAPRGASSIPRCRQLSGA